MRSHPTLAALLLGAAVLHAADDYQPGPDSLPQAVPHGEVRQASFTRSRIFPGTTREYFVYVPRQYDPAKSACLMVFFDGAGFMKPEGAFRVPVVFDNLIAKEEMPVTIAVGVNPGVVPATLPGAKPRSHRSLEYDSLGDANARFLLDELLPEATKGLNITSDPAGRAICGNSSGGIAAFTAAWERPDAFGKVVSHIGSFTNIRGGHVYPALIRKTTPAKPLRVFLQDGRNDLDNLHGNWPLANEDMAAALTLAGYDHRFVLGDGTHSGRHGGAIFPDTLRWLWREETARPLETGAAPRTRPGDGFRPTRDHEPQPGVPRGAVTAMPPWQSRIFPGTTRDWWIYVPAQYKPDGSAALMVFQDGQNYINPQGNWRVPIVFDNLTARGEMPPTVAVFINPGHEPAKGQPKSPTSGSNRSFEYDSLGDRYARLLIEEILPAVASRYPFSQDPERHAIAGSSSGGIASFTVAWERPGHFRKVLSTVGSFVNIRGGNDYPALIRKTERKPLRVYLEDVSRDLDNPRGNWPIANRQMHAALKYMGYDVRFDFAEGYGHNSLHAGSVLPDALRWLWRAGKPVPALDTKGDLAVDMTLHRLLIDGEGWQPVVEGLTFADAACTDAEGNFYFSDVRAGGIFRLAADGSRTKLSAEAASGLKFGPDGRLYGCLGSKKHLFALTPASGALEIIAENVQPNDFVITDRGHIYFTETQKKQVTFVDVTTKALRVMDTGIAAPNGITLSPDQGTLAVSESQGQFVWTFRINPDGALDAKAPYMTMRRPIDPKGEFRPQEPPPYLPRAGGDGMTSDTLGRYYVTTALGVQVFDPTGRLCGVVDKPQPDKPLTSIVLAGPHRDTLYVTNGDRIFRRKVQAAGTPVGGRSRGLSE